MNKKNLIKEVLEDARYSRIIVVKGYTIKVNYNLSVEDAVKRGLYDRFGSSINSENFPANHKGKAKIAVELLSLNREMSLDDVLHKLDQLGYRPAGFRELLAFGEKYPDAQRESPITALGSILRDGACRFIPVLNEDWRMDRFIALYDFEEDHLFACRTAVVRKPA